MENFIFEEIPLKEFFKLFEKDEELDIIELGDTAHPSSGFVDQTYFKQIKTVGDLMEVDYDFNGLVILIAKVRGLIIEYHENRYKIIGEKKDIDKIKFN